MSFVFWCVQYVLSEAWSSLLIFTHLHQLTKIGRGLIKRQMLYFGFLNAEYKIVMIWEICITKHNFSYTCEEVHLSFYASYKDAMRWHYSKNIHGLVTLEVLMLVTDESCLLGYDCCLVEFYHCFGGTCYNHLMDESIVLLVQ